MVQLNCSIHAVAFVLKSKLYAIVLIFVCFTLHDQNITDHNSDKCNFKINSA